MTNQPPKIYRLAIRVAAAVAVAAVFAFLAFKAAAPSGEMVVSTDLVRPAPFVSAPKPADRLEQLAGQPAGGAKLVGSPIYFDLAPPSRFDSVEVRAHYRNPAGSWLEIGALTSAISNQFTLSPAESRLIDVLPWSRVTSGRRQLLERERSYATVESFMADPPPSERIATLDANWYPPFRIKDYAPASQTRDFTLSLRGRQRILAYVKAETLHFGFSLQDMNREPGPDPVTVTVFRLGETAPLARAELPDDGNVSDDQRSSGLRPLAVSVADLAEGTYLVEFTATNDVFIRTLTASPAKFVFLNRLYLGDHVGYSDRTDPITVLVSGQSLLAKTGHPESLQTISVGGVKLILGETNVKYAATLPAGGPTAVRVPKSDVVLEGDGLFALSRDSWFDPVPLNVDWFTTVAGLDQRHVDYVLTDYQTPTVEAGDTVATAVFDAASLATTKEGAYRFVLHAPAAATGNVPELVLDRVDFVLRREPLTWRDAWARLRQGVVAQDDDLPLPRGFSFDESPE